LPMRRKCRFDLGAIDSRSCSWFPGAVAIRAFVFGKGAAYALPGLPLFHELIYGYVSCQKGMPELAPCRGVGHRLYGERSANGGLEGEKGGGGAMT
jgi:hypothetical protein